MKRKIFIITLFLFIVGLMAGCNIGGLGGDDTGDDSQQRDIYDSATSDKKSYEEWLRSIKGSDGRDIELFVMDNTVVWRYVGDSVAIPLFSIESINGTNGINGINGTDGQDGREVAIRFFNNTLQWHYTDENEWNTLFDTNSLKGEPGDNGIGIRSIAKIKTEDLVDTYAITFTDGTLTTFTVTNGVKGGQGEKGDKGDKGDQGEQGVGIKSVNKISSEDLIDTYEIVFSDDTTTTFTIANGAAGEAGEKGNGIVKIELTESPNAFLDIYTIYFEDETTFDFEVHHGEPLDQRMYTVTFDSDGGTEIEDQEVKFGYKAVAPDTPVKEGYKFLGWYIGDEKWSFIGYFITENINLVAKWELATYELNYEYNGGEEVEDATTEYTMLDDDIDLPTPERFGYEFLGWCATEELINPTDVLPSGSTGNRTLYAKWQANTHTIKFESNGGTRYDDLEFGFGEEVELPTPERTGYGFVYWSTEENMQHEYKGSYEEDTDLTLYARWIVDGNAPYTVQVFLQNLDGTYSMKPYEELVYDDVPETTVSAPIGYYPGFNNPNYTPTGLVVSDGSLKLKLFYPRATYQISVSDGMGNWTYPQFKYGETINLTDPEKVGYVFTGWDREVPETMPSYGFTIRATWQANLYKVTFDANGGDDIEMREYMYGQQYELPTPVFEGHEFAGWYYNGSKVEDGVWSYLKNVTLVANWATVSDDFVFAQVEDHLEVISYNGNETEITIPTTADGMPVTAIADNAFNGNQSLTKIIMQVGITSIGDNAFANMTELKELVLPYTITSYGSDMLTGSNSIEKITISSLFNKQLKYLFGNNIANVPASLVKIKFATGCTEISKTMWSVEKLKNEGDPIVLELADDWTSVPSYAFQSCNGISSLIIPEGVQYIYDYAFQRCSKLVKVVFPTTLRSIYSNAFESCYLLEDINLEDCSSLEQISYMGFRDCDQITEITLPHNITSIGMYAFSCMDNLVTFNFNERLTQIESYCFEASAKLKVVTLPSSINYIYGRAFSGCTSLTLVIIPRGINQINEAVFYNCYSATILCEEESKPNNWSTSWANNGPTVVWGYKEVTTINGYTCAITADNTAIIIGAEDLTKTSYEFPAKVGTYEVIDINLSAIFRENEVVEEVYIPDYITVIPGYCFYNCTSLKRVVFGENTSVADIGSYAFYNCNSLKTIAIPYGVSTIQNYTFQNCNNLRVVVFPSSVTTIYDQAFYNDYSIVKVFYDGTLNDRNNIPNYWGNDGFFNTSWEYESTVKDVTYVETDNYSYILTDTNAVLNFSLTNREFEEFSFDDIEGITLTEISNNMFSECRNLKSITIPSTITRIGYNAFLNCTSLESVVFEEGSQLATIEYQAFSNCTSLTEITIPATVTRIGYNAFQSCTSLKTVEFEENSQLSTIEYQAFSNCTSLTKIDIPDTVKTIDYNAFYNCSKLTGIVLPSALEYLGNEAFRGCNKITSVIIPSTVTSMGYRVFHNDSQSVSLYCKVESKPDGWNDDWYRGNYSNSIVWNVKDFGSTDDFDYIVNNNDEVIVTKMADSKLVSFEFEDSVDGYTIVELGANLFKNSTKLTSITLPANLKRIGNYAFYECNKITEIVLPDTIEVIGSYAFQSCDRLSKVSGAKNLKEIGEYAFYGDNVLISFTGPEAVEYIRSFAFYECYSMNQIFSLDSVKRIETYAFRSAYNLFTTLYLKSVEFIGSYAFAYDHKMSAIILPNTLTTIEYRAFQECYALSCVYIPSSVTMVGERIFDYVEGSNITIYCGAAEEQDDWNVNWNCNSANEEWDCNDRIIITDDAMYYIKDDDTLLLLSFFGNETEVFKLGGVNEKEVSEIARYAFFRTNHLKKLFIPATVSDIAEYALYENYDAGQIDIFIECDSRPAGWSPSWASNGNYNTNWSENMNVEIKKITLKSSDQTISWDGNYHTSTTEVTIIDGELDEGHELNWNSWSGVSEIGTYSADFGCSINETLSGKDVTKYYIIEKEYGTLTITPAE